MLKVLIVEEIPALRKHAAAVIKQALPETMAVEIFEAHNERSALEMFRAHRPEAVVIDTFMSRIAGITLANEMWSIVPRTKILFWSRFHREAYLGKISRLAPLESVYGYVLKNEGDEKFKYAVSSVVAHNNNYIDPVARHSSLTLSGRTISLTQTEYETLVDVILGLTDRAVAKRRGLTVRGVQNRLSNLTNKLMRKESWRGRSANEPEIYNARIRLVLEALKKGYMTTEDLAEAEQSLTEWLEKEFSAVQPSSNLAKQTSFINPKLSHINQTPESASFSQNAFHLQQS